MLFAANEEEAMIAQSVASVLAEPEGPERWEKLVALGLTASTWPEDHGGAGMGLSAVLPLLIAAGRTAAPEPLIGCAVLPGLALCRAGDAAPTLPEGVLCVATQNSLQVAEGRVSGQLKAVIGADLATNVLACLPDDRLCVLPCDQRAAYRLVDGRAAADVLLDQAMPNALGAPVPGLAAWLSDVAATAFAADALGALLAAREMTLEYLKNRQQFGRPLGSFQALQHAMVDLYHDTEHFHSLVLLAAHACDSDDAHLRVRSVAAVKHYLGGRIRRAAANAIQLHGGIGVTEDYALGRLVKRLLIADMLNGRADEHTARLAHCIAQETHAHSPQESAP
ncbi:MAG: acyl-CoA dehydrogenase [Pseudomonadota bacterium]